MWNYIVTWTLVFVVSNYNDDTKKRETKHFFCNNKIETLVREDAFIEYNRAKEQPISNEMYITKVKIDSVFIPLKK